MKDNKIEVDLESNMELKVYAKKIFYINKLFNNFQRSNGSLDNFEKSKEGLSIENSLKQKKSLNTFYFTSRTF